MRSTRPAGCAGASRRAAPSRARRRLRATGSTSARTTATSMRSMRQPASRSGARPPSRASDTGARSTPRLPSRTDGTTSARPIERSTRSARRAGRSVGHARPAATCTRRRRSGTASSWSAPTTGRSTRSTRRRGTYVGASRRTGPSPARRRCSRDRLLRDAAPAHLCAPGQDRPSALDISRREVLAGGADAKQLYLVGYGRLYGMVPAKRRLTHHWSRHEPEVPTDVDLGPDHCDRTDGRDSLPACQIHRPSKSLPSGGSNAPPPAGAPGIYRSRRHLERADKAEARLWMPRRGCRRARIEESERRTTLATDEIEVPPTKTECPETTMDAISPSPCSGRISGFQSVESVPDHVDRGKVMSRHATHGVERSTHIYRVVGQCKSFDSERGVGGGAPAGRSASGDVDGCRLLRDSPPTVLNHPAI